MNSLLRDYPDVATRYLKIAEGGVFTTPTAVQTVLGSCVAVTLFCPDLRAGGTFHGFLPNWAEYERSPSDMNHFRYVDSGIEYLVNQFQRLGVRTQRLEAKIFGGGNVMLEGEINIGLKNVAAAFNSLAAHQIRVTVSSVGGFTGRKLLFISSTGEVFIKNLKSRLQCKP